MKDIKFVDISETSNKLKEKVKQWRNSEKIRKFMLTQHIITKEEHYEWIEKLKRKRDQKFWVVFIGNIPIGSIYLQKINHRELVSEWGFYIGEDAYRGKGLGKCILFKFLEMFFEKIGFNTLITKVLSNNIIALNLYEEFKFEEMNRLPFRGKEKIVLLKFSKEDWIESKGELNNECYYRNKK